MTSRALKPISAFFIAATLLIIAYIAAWFGVMTYAEMTLSKHLSKVFGGDVHYSSVRWNYHPAKLSMQINDLKIDFEKQNMSYDMGSTVIEASILRGMRVDVSFAPIQNLKMGDKDYSIRLSDAKFTYYPEFDKEEGRFVANQIQVMQNDKPFASAHAVKLSRGLSSADKSFVVSMKDVKTNTDDMQFAMLMLDIDIESSVLANKQMYVNYLSESPEWPKFFEMMAERSVKSSKPFSINKFRVQRGDWWISGSGDVEIDERKRPEGELSINCNASKMMMAFLGRRNLVDSSLFDKSTMFKTLMVDDKMMSMDFSIKQGTIALNGVPVGLSPTLPTLVAHLVNKP